MAVSGSKWQGRKRICILTLWMQINEDDEEIILNDDAIFVLVPSLARYVVAITKCKSGENDVYRQRFYANAFLGQVQVNMYKINR